jgi:2-polyprenyl-6-methoxyphenol hydroxylase-like FAD-dependent oxidoreductase
MSTARSDLSRLWFDEVKDHTEAIFGDEITGLRERTDGVQVAFKQGGERRFDLVIGADGLHSSVRRLAFGPEQAFEKRLGYAVAAFQSRGYRPRDEDIYVMYGGPGRMVGRFALHDDRTLFLFVFATGDTALPQALDRQKEMLRTIYGDRSWECPEILAQLDAAPELYFDSVSQIRMESWTKGRVALVGDAAFCVSLVAGQGSALAMISAYVLAGALTRAEGRYAEAFRDYDKILREYVAKKQHGAERFAAAFAPMTRYGLWFRNQVLNACALPGLARLAVGREIIDTLRLPAFRWPHA